MSLEIPSFDIFTGSDIGYLKACCFQNKSPVTINRVEESKKELGINCLCWGNKEKSTIYTGCKYGRVLRYCLKSSSCVQLHDNDVSESEKKPVLKDMRILESTSILAFSSGQVKITNFNENGIEDFETGEQELRQSCNEINAGPDLFCMDQNIQSISQVLTGGKKNPLKIWDVSKSNEEPIFTAKNVKNDWLNLHVPIWVTQAKFVSGGHKVITGTGYSQIRMYDTLAQRRPVLEMKYEENPITAMAVRSNKDHEVLIGNTIGNIALLDIRKKAIVKGFKGSRGGITDLQLHPSQDVFATCGVDRFVNCYNFEHKAPLYSVYMQSSLNCILFSSNWSPDDYVIVEKGNSESAVPMSSEIDSNIDNDGVDDILNSMDVVKTKKRKQEDSTNQKKRKRNK